MSGGFVSSGVTPAQAANLDAKISSRQPSTKNIQRGQITIASAADTGTATITAVVLANSRISLLGYESSDIAPLAYKGTVQVILTNTTTVTASRSNAGSGLALDTVVGFEVEESN